MAYRIITTPEFRLVWPSLFTPRNHFPDQSSRQKYQAGLAFDGNADLTELLTLAEEESMHRFGNTHALLRSKAITLSNGIHQLFNAQSGFRPYTRVAKDGNYYRANEDDMKRGSLCIAEVAVFSYEYQNNRGIGLSLESVTKLGEPPVDALELEALGLDAWMDETR